MSKDLIKQDTGLVPQIPQTAKTIYNIDEIKNFNHTSQIFVMGGLPGMPKAAPTQVTYSRDYYNLIVYGDEPMLTDCHITLDKDRCLVELQHITEELRDRFSPLTPEIIEELKGFLCILACENRHYGWTDEDHFASIALLTDVKNRSNGIELSSLALSGISNSSLPLICAQPVNPGFTSFAPYLSRSAVSKS